MKEQNEKQAIEEMAAFLWKNTLIHTEDLCHDVAETVIIEGYRKQSVGEWILTGTFKSTFPLPVADLHTACSVCGWKPPKYSDDYKEYNFCPNCGARMKGGAE